MTWRKKLSILASVRIATESLESPIDLPAVVPETDPISALSTRGWKPSAQRQSDTILAGD
jgi:hypothetical protein